MQNCLPHNQICQDLLDGPSSLEHPREIIYLAHFRQPARKSFKSSEDVLPLARWFLSYPSVRQIPSLPVLPLARSHPDDLDGPWSPGERSSRAGVQWVYKLYWTFVLAVWQSKHLLLKVYWTRTSSVILIEVTNLIVYHYSREPFKPFQKRANWERSKNERCILAPSKVNWQPFSPGFPLSPILPGLPSWPW